MATEKKHFSGYMMAALAALMTFTCGMSYGAYGMLIIPLSERLGCSITAAGIPATLETYAAFAMGLIGGGVLIEKLTARRCVLVGALIASLFVGSYVWAPNLMILCVWEVITGASMAFGYINGMAAFIKEWFVERRETVLGVAIAANGFGSAVGNWMFGYLDTRYGIDVTAIAFAAVGVLCILVYVLFLRNPDQVGQKALGYEKALELAAEEGKAENDSEFGIDYKTALRSPSLYLVLASCLLWALVMVLSPYLATILMTNGVDEMAAASYSSINNLATAGMAILVGFLTSKLGPRSYVIAAFGSCIAGCVLLLLWLESVRTPVMIVLAAIALGAGYCVGSTYGTMICTKVFGQKAYARIINLVFGMRSIGLGTGVLVIPTLATKSGSWFLPIIVGIVALVGAIICGLLALKLSPMKKLHNNVNI